MSGGGYNRRPDRDHPRRPQRYYDTGPGHHDNRPHGRQGQGERQRQRQHSNDWNSNSNGYGRNDGGWQNDMSHDPAQFSRRSDANDSARRSGLDDESFLLVQKLQDHKKYLEMRMEQIIKNNQLRALADDVEDIHFVNEAMRDVGSDVPTLKRAYEIVIEMARKYPIPEAYEANQANSDEEDADQGTASSRPDFGPPPPLDPLPSNPQPPPHHPQPQSSHVQPPPTLSTDFNIRPTSSSYKEPHPTIPDPTFDWGGTELMSKAEARTYQRPPTSPPRTNHGPRMIPQVDTGPHTLSSSNPLLFPTPRAVRPHAYPPTATSTSFHPPAPSVPSHIQGLRPPPPMMRNLSFDDSQRSGSGSMDFQGQARDYGHGHMGTPPMSTHQGYPQNGHQYHQSQPAPFHQVPFQHAPYHNAPAPAEYHNAPAQSQPPHPNLDFHRRQPQSQSQPDYSPDRDRDPYRDPPPPQYPQDPRVNMNMSRFPPPHSHPQNQFQGGQPQPQGPGQGPRPQLQSPPPGPSEAELLRQMREKAFNCFHVNPRGRDPRGVGSRPRHPGPGPRAPPPPLHRRLNGNGPRNPRPRLQAPPPPIIPSQLPSSLVASNQILAEPPKGRLARTASGSEVTGQSSSLLNRSGLDLMAVAERVRQKVAAKPKTQSKLIDFRKTMEKVIPTVTKGVKKRTSVSVSVEMDDGQMPGPSQPQSQSSSSSPQKGKGRGRGRGGSEGGGKRGRGRSRSGSVRSRASVIWSDDEESADDESEVSSILPTSPSHSSTEETSSVQETNAIREDIERSVSPGTAALFTEDPERFTQIIKLVSTLMKTKSQGQGQGQGQSEEAESRSRSPPPPAKDKNKNKNKDKLKSKTPPKIPTAKKKGTRVSRVAVNARPKPKPKQAQASKSRDKTPVRTPTPMDSSSTLSNSTSTCTSESSAESNNKKRRKEQKSYNGSSGSGNVNEKKRKRDSGADKDNDKGSEEDTSSSVVINDNAKKDSRRHSHKNKKSKSKKNKKSKSKSKSKSGDERDIWKERSDGVIGPRDTVVSLGLGKVKMEKDYVPPPNVKVETQTRPDEEDSDHTVENDPPESVASGEGGQGSRQGQVEGPTPVPGQGLAQPLNDEEQEMEMDFPPYTIKVEELDVSDYEPDDPLENEMEEMFAEDNDNVNGNGDEMES